jgi:hypothetical protein
MLTSMSQNGYSQFGQSEAFNDNYTKDNHNRSSLLVLSTSREDDDDRVYSLRAGGGGEVMDPKTLI